LDAYQRFDLCHNGIEQRWLVTLSQKSFLGIPKIMAKERAGQGK
jgi:hypothetical protein